MPAPWISTKVNKERQRRERFGRRAEFWAALFLRLKGYRILKTRFKSPVGEVDLIARKRNTLIFIEVKARHKLSDALWALQPKQIARIIRCAELFLAHHPKYNSFEQRFDAICIIPRRLPVHMKHIVAD